MKNRNFLTVIFILSVIIAFLLGFIASGLILSTDDKSNAESPVSPSEESAAPSWTPTETPSLEESEIPQEDIEETAQPVESSGPEISDGVDLSALKAELDAKFADYASDWVILVQDLDSGEQIVTSTNGLSGSDPMTAASVIKLFIAGAVYDNAQNNGTELDELTTLSIESMITASDNNAANNLIVSLGNGDSDLGISAVNGFIDRIGCSSTTLNRLMLDTGEENLVSASDCAKILSMIYSGTYVSQSASDAILDMMSRQERRNKIPAGLDGFEGVSVANKTGELYSPDHDNTENDVAIITTPNGDYILCILATKIYNNADAITTFAEVSRTVCGYYNS